MAQFAISPVDPGDNDIRSDIKRLPNGNLVVAYEHSVSGNRVLAIRVIMPDGTPVTNEIFVGAQRFFPKITIVDDSHFTIVVADNVTTPGYYALVARTFTLAGSTITPVANFTLSDNDASDDNGSGHEVTRLPDGKYLVTWAQFTTNSTTSQITSRVFDANWSPLTPETRISEFNNTGVQNVHQTMNGNTAIVSWTQNDPSTGSSLHGRLATFTVGAGGTLPASPPNDVDIGSNTTIQETIKLANGDILVLFNGGPTQGGSLDDNDKLTGRIYNSTLTSIVKADFLVNTNVDDNGTTTVSAVAFAGGGFEIFWGQDPAGGTNSSTDIEMFSRVYNKNYVAATATQLTNDSVNDYDPTATVDAQGNVTLIWQTTSTGVNGSQVGLYLASQDPDFVANSAPSVNHNLGLTLNEGGTGTLTAARLDFNDAEQADTAITYTLTGLPTHGVIKLSGVTLTANQTFTQDDLNNNRVTYVHDGGETTSDSVGFTVSDGQGGTVAGQNFALTITPVNDAPTQAGLPANFAFTEDTQGNVDLSAVTFADVDSASVTVTLTASLGGALAATSGGGVTVSGGGTATLTLTGAPSAINTYLDTVSAVKYTPPANVNGAGNISIAVSDGALVAGPTSVSINVAAVNDAPVGMADTGSVTQRLTTTGQVRTNDSDVDNANNTLTVSAVHAGAGVGGDTPVVLGTPTTLSGAYGMLTINNDGSYSYVADAEGLAVGAVGSDVFTYTVRDPGGLTSTATLTVSVTGSPNGDGAANILIGGAGADTLLGFGGADQLTGNGGADTLDGGAGDDQMTGGAGNDVYFVDSAGDVITEAAGDSGDEVRTTLASFTLGVTAGSANVENLTGLSGAGQILIGNGGANAITGGGGNDTLVGGAGADALVGGGGEDFADYGASTAAVTVNLATNVNTGGEAQGDTLTGVEDLAGSGYGDTLTGDGADNALFGGGGSDIIHGGGGADRIVGAQQALFGEGDQLFGDGGNDTIYGVNGDVIDGGTGTDVLLANSAANFTIDLAASSIEYAVMAAGNDTVNASAQTVRVDVYAGGGNDTVTGSTFNDTLWGEAGDDILSGGAGGDILVGGAGSDRLVGGAGNDALYGGAGDGVQDTFVFSSAGAADADAIYDFVHGVDKIDMSAFATTFAHIGITALAGAAIVFLDGQHVATVVGAAGTLTASDFIFSSPAPGQPQAADPTVPVVSVDPTGHATSGFDDGGTPTRDVVFSDETPGGMGAVHFSDDTAAPVRATALTAPPEPAFVATGVTFSTLDVSPFDRHAMPWDGAFAVAVISGEDNGHWMV